MVEVRLSRQIEFIKEIGKLKNVYRRAYIEDASRRENSAEHCWHVTIAALILAEHCPGEIDLPNVLKMLLSHDIVEIDAGDTGIYDTAGALDKAERENMAAEHIFSLLPADQKHELQELWNEFEEGKTPEAKYARAVDRFMLLLHNFCTQGKRWLQDGITYEQVFAVNQTIQEGSPELWEFALSMIDECVSRGYLPRAGNAAGD